MPTLIDMVAGAIVEGRVPIKPSSDIPYHRLQNVELLSLDEQTVQAAYSTMLLDSSNEDLRRYAQRVATQYADEAIRGVFSNLLESIIV